MRSSIKILMLVVGVAATLAASSLNPESPAAQPSSPARVVARVNGVAITEAQLAREVERLYPSTEGHGRIRPEKLDELRSQAIEELIVQELAWQQALQEGRAVSMVEVRRERLRLRRKYGAQQFDRMLQDRGLTRQQYLETLQRQMTLEAAYHRKVTSPSRISPGALRAHYQKNVQKYRRPERVRLRLILVAVDPQALPQQVRAARQKAEQIHAQLVAGKDFAALAHEFSDDAYRVKGGDVGWLHKGNVDPEFDTLAFTLPVGQFSQPLRTPWGFSIVKVEAREPGKLLSFNEVRPRLKQELERKRADGLRQQWIAALKKDARIVIYDAKPGAEGGVSAAHATGRAK